MGISRTARACATITVLALTLSACGDGDATSEGADAAEPAGEETPADGAVDAPDADGDEADPAEAALVAADGWGELHDLDLPDAGTAVLRVDGQELVADVTCNQPGEIPDEIMDHNTPLNEFIVFWVTLSGTGQADDGSGFRLTAERGLHIAGDRFLNIGHAGWGGQGQLDAVSLSTDAGVARQQSPSSDDPEGEALPLVRVDPSGAITAQGELRPEFEGDEAPAGPFTLAARCQDGWPEDQLP